MDTYQDSSFSTREEEITRMLVEAGLKQNYSRVLVFLFHHSDLTSRDIERGTSLRQPEVSIAINFLISQGWAEISSLITENKGRPVKLYRLSASIDTILDDIEAGKKEEYLTQIEVIEKVRRLIHGSEQP